MGSDDSKLLLVFYRRLKKCLCGCISVAGLNWLRPLCDRMCRYSILSYDQLGTAGNRRPCRQRLRTFVKHLRDMKERGLAQHLRLCQVRSRPRQFFELLFRPVFDRKTVPRPMFTGYFEPELDGDLYLVCPLSHIRFNAMPQRQENTLAAAPWIFWTLNVMKGRP